MEILAVIPGRKGSKGVINKNIRKINGKPLISYSIEEALKSKFIKKIVVSSDSDEILEIARNLNVETIKRPKHLAEDDSTTIDVIKHVLDSVRDNSNNIPDLIILLQPTSPLRDSNHIDEAITKFLEEKNVDSLVSVCEMDHNPLWSFKIDNGFLSPAFDERLINKRRQDLPLFFLPNGAIFIGKPDKILEKNSFYTEKTMAFLMDKEKSVDIDTEFDFKIVECLLNQKS
jgi:CMP-N-acetylneuraminic acid synthetase